MAAGWLIWIGLLGVLQASPAAPPPDRTADTAGTAVIRGRVVAADTGAPFRRATVTLSGVASGTQSQHHFLMRTDADGRFEFTRLPAGVWFLHADPGPHNGFYVPAGFGSSHSPRGDPIELADGQVRERMDLRLFRGGVITGRIVDDEGEPLARVYVTAVSLSRGRNQRAAVESDPSETDDLGRFRIYRLRPGTYLVRADIAQRDVLVPIEVGAPEETALVSSFHPGTETEAAADVVQVGPAQEVTADIRMIRARTFRISGTILDVHGSPGLAFGEVLVKGPRPYLRTRPFRSDPQGRFTVDSLPPGEYVVRARSARARPERAVVAVSVGHADLDGVIITVRPGVTVAGEVVLEGARPGDGPDLMLLARSTDPMFDHGLTVRVKEDRTFAFEELMGPVLIRQASVSFRWYLQSVLLGDRDISDTPTEFTAADSGRLRVVLTARAARLEGRVSDERGEPLREGVVVVFPEDSTAWDSRAIRTRWGRILPTGQFSVTGLLPGRYLAVAVPGPAIQDLFDGVGPEFFEPLVPDATPLVVTGDETRTLDLRVARLFP